jgi:hypothetical protein
MGSSAFDQSKRQKGKRFERKPKITVHADWTGVSGELLRALVGTMTKDGKAIRLGYSRDGGAYAIGIYGDAETPYTVYCGVNDDIDSFLADIITEFNGLLPE